MVIIIIISLSHIVYNIIEKIYICDSARFDEILNKFINNEYSISIFTINLILRYIS